jgi:hypothetical protein
MAITLHDSNGCVVDSVTATVHNLTTIAEIVGLATITTSAAEQALQIQGKIAKGVTKATGHAWRAGDTIYYNGSSATRTPDSIILGVAYEDATAAAETGNVLLDIRPGRMLDAAQVAASSAVSDSATETAFDKTATISGGRLVDGSCVHIRAFGKVTAASSTDTLQLKLKMDDGTNTIVLGTTTALDVSDNDTFLIDSIVTVRADGSSGTMVASGWYAEDAEGTAAMQQDTVDSSTVDTTEDITVSVTANWSAADAGNSVRLDQLIVEEIGL